MEVHCRRKRFFFLAPLFFSLFLLLCCLSSVNDTVVLTPRSFGRLHGDSFLVVSTGATISFPMRSAMKWLSSKLGNNPPDSTPTNFTRVPLYRKLYQNPSKWFSACQPQASVPQQTSSLSVGHRTPLY